MSAVNEILNRVPMDQLAAQLGTDEQTARAAAQAATTQLLGGLADNAQSTDGELSLAGALADHGRSTLFDSETIDLDQVDTTDGGKIVGHVFGDTEAVALSGAQQAASGNVDQDMMMKVLKLLAPIVLAYLAKNLQDGKYGDILGSILGGAAGGQQGGQAGGGILGQILGGILGGGVLGGALGGQKAPTPEPQIQAPEQNDSFQPPAPRHDGGLQMDDGTDGADAGDQPTTRRAQEDEQQGSGSVIGDILGKIFGR